MTAAAAPAHTTAMRELEQDLKRATAGEVRFDPYSREMYATDGSIYRIEPLGVVLPRDADDVSATIETAARHGAPVLPRGGGTGLAGQTVNRAVVIDFSKYMHDVLEVNAEERWVKTQPGISIGELNRQLAATGLHFTPDPSTANRANIGGAIGNNSCGAHSIVYGKTVDHVLDLDVTLSDGTQTHFGRVESAGLESNMSGSGLEAAIYRGVRRIAEEARDEVGRRFPKIMRRVGGYNLDLVLDTEDYNLARLVVGSEGTLAAVTGARLNLVPIPTNRGLAVLHFSSIDEAMEATVATLEEHPDAVEHIGSMIIRQARQSLGFSRNIGFLQGEPSDILVVEFSGESTAETSDKLDKLGERMRRNGLGFAITNLLDAAGQRKVWNMREAGLGLLMNMPGDAKPLPFVEDTAVSPEKLPEYVRRFDEIVRRHDTEAGYYGHASVGCLHIRPVVNLKKRDDIAKMHAIASEVSDLVLEFGGAMSAEHGDGIARSEWNEKMFGPELYKAFREVKAAFDPKGIMNPGKIVDAPPMTQNLRYGETYRTTPVETRFDWSADNGFAGAVERCNGVGACRKVNSGAMCPSYMATREEEHSTRGRANALRAALSGALPHGQFDSDRMFDVLDLCLECKSCKSECPSNVDMAKIKYEFLNTYYKSHRRPIRSRMVGDIHRLNAILRPLAPVANALSGSAAARWFGDVVMGMDRRRRFPALSRRSFDSWFRSRTPQSTGSRGVAVLFHDTFTNFNHPQAGVAATRLLESLGFEVKIADRKCCGRPMISKGMIDKAASNARHNIDVLHPLVESGARIVGWEASCLLTLKDEYPDLFPDDPRARAVADAAVMIETLLAETAGDGAQQIEWSDRVASVAAQVHCHQRALVGTGDAEAALNLPPGYSAEIIDAGCCGMAGSFGFEKEHYDVSMQVGEDRLFPFVRAAPDNVEVAVTGVSCHQQIADGTGRPARYLVEVLGDALA